MKNESTQKELEQILSQGIFSQSEKNLICRQSSVKNIFNENKPSKIKFIQNFKSQKEIDKLKKDEKFKYISRNILGVRKHDDWINNLEIGNVMHLNPITTQELMQNIGKHHEFQKDPMLKKIVLTVVSFFSIATEIRMISQQNEQKPT